MRKILVLLLLTLFSAKGALAGVNSQLLKVDGDSTNTPPVDAVGFATLEDTDHLTFSYKAGKDAELGRFPADDFDLPYREITRLVYGQTKHLRVGQTIALTALAGAGGLLLLLSKAHTHYLTLEYTDKDAKAQVISFEVGKDVIRPLLSQLEVRTGKKVETEAPTQQAKP